MAEKRRYDVFLSYAPEDRPWVKAFVDTLRDEGRTAFFDAADLAPGELREDRIQEALRESRVLVLIVSPHHLDRMWTFFVLGAAIADEKTIIPVVAEEIPAGQWPLFLTRYQALHEPSPQESGKRLADVLGVERPVA